MTSTNWLDLLSEAKNNGGSQDFGPIPAGEYEFLVKEAETRQTANGKTKYTVKAEVQNGAHAGRLVWDDLIVSPESAGAMGFFFRKLKAIGLDENFFATAPSDDQITAALTNRKFLGKVIVDNYGGKDRNKIDGYKPLTAASAGGFIPPAPQQAAPPAPAPQQQAPAAAPAPAQQQAPAPQPQAAPAPQQAPAQAPWDQGAAAPAPQPQAPAQAAPQGGSPWDNGPAAAPAAPAPAPNFPQPPF